jgi:hypothetical protein
LKKTTGGAYSGRAFEIEEELMRFSNVILALSAFGLSAAAGLAGCGNSSETTGSGGSTTGTTATTGTMTTSTTTGGMTYPCSPKASCTAKDKECLGLVDNAGKTKFGLRMVDLVISKPPALATGLVAGVVAASVTPTLKSCNLNGSGTFSWLLQFDTAAGTLTTGGAKPVADPTMGYSFVNEMVSGVQIAPAVYMIKPDAAGKFDVMTGADLNVPIYLDAAATMAVVLPLKRGRLTMGTLSASQNCIGSYNAKGLDPASSCLPDAKHPQFLTGASLDGIITLVAADGVIISATNQSLCSLLAGAANSTKNAMGVNVCKRDASMNIIFQGDTCSTEGMACTDAVTLGADFAANSVVIN